MGYSTSCKFLFGQVQRYAIGLVFNYSLVNGQRKKKLIQVARYAWLCVITEASTVNDGLFQYTKNPAISTEVAMCRIYKRTSTQLVLG